MLISPTINSFHGRIINVQSANPSAGAELTHTVPARRRWLLHGLVFTLSADANVADRTVSIDIIDGARGIRLIPAAFVHTANVIKRYDFISGYLVETSANQVQVPFGIPIPLMAGYIIATITTNIQVGDDYGLMDMLVEEWIDP